MYSNRLVLHNLFVDHLETLVLQLAGHTVVDKALGHLLHELLGKLFKLGLTVALALGAYLAPPAFVPADAKLYVAFCQDNLFFTGEVFCEDFTVGKLHLDLLLGLSS